MINLLAVMATAFACGIDVVIGNQTWMIINAVLATLNAHIVYNKMK